MFKVDPDAMEAIKNICCAKGEGAVDNISFKKFCPSFKNVDNQARSGRPKTIDSDSVLPAMETNLASNTWRVSGNLSFTQSSVIHYLHDLDKSIQICTIVSHITKILQNI